MVRRQASASACSSEVPVPSASMTMKASDSCAA